MFSNSLSVRIPVHGICTRLKNRWNVSAIKSWQIQVCVFKMLLNNFFSFFLKIKLYFWTWNQETANFELYVCYNGFNF
jgi:hypothetical protein